MNSALENKRLQTNKPQCITVRKLFLVVLVIVNLTVTTWASHLLVHSMFKGMVTLDIQLTCIMNPNIICTLTSKLCSDVIMETNDKILVT